MTPKRAPAGPAAGRSGVTQIDAIQPKNKPTAASEKGHRIADKHEEDQAPEHERGHHVEGDH